MMIRNLVLAIGAGSLIAACDPASIDGDTKSCAIAKVAEAAAAYDESVDLKTFALAAALVVVNDCGLLESQAEPIAASIEIGIESAD